MLPHNFFKFVMPVGLREITSSLGSNMQYGIRQIGSKAFLTVIKPINGVLKAYFTDIAECNLQQINAESQKDADLSIIYDSCKGTIHKVAKIIMNGDQHNIVLDGQTITSYSNGTVDFLGQNLKKAGEFLLDPKTNKPTLIVLPSCSEEDVLRGMTSYNTYLEDQITKEERIEYLKHNFDKLGLTSYISDVRFGDMIRELLGNPALATKEYLDKVLADSGITYDSFFELGEKLYKLLNNYVPDANTSFRKMLDYLNPSVTSYLEFGEAKYGRLYNATEKSDHTNDGSNAGIYITNAVLGVATICSLGSALYIWRKGRKENKELKDKNTELENGAKSKEDYDKLIEDILARDDIVEIISEIGFLDDVIEKIVQNDGYQLPIEKQDLKISLEDFNRELKELNSARKFTSQTPILNKMSELLRGDQFIAFKSFKDFVQKIRKDINPEEQYKKLGKLFGINSEVYDLIDEGVSSGGSSDVAINFDCHHVSQPTEGVPLIEVPSFNAPELP